MTRRKWRDGALEARNLALNGRMIEAIRLIRQETGCGLIEARDAVLILMNMRWEDGKGWLPESRGLLVRLLRSR